MANTPSVSTATRTIGAARGRVELAGVSFRYSEAHPWLYRNLDMNFAPGELTVITGPSGCGKSTLAKLVQGFHPPAGGRIRHDTAMQGDGACQRARLHGLRAQ